MLSGNDTTSNINDIGRGQVRNNLLKKAKRKALRMSIFIVIAFIVCWFPYYVLFTGNAFGQWKELSPSLMAGLSTMGLSNSMLNPIIYGAFQLCKVHRPRLVWRTVVSKPCGNDFIYLLVKEGEKATFTKRGPIISLRLSDQPNSEGQCPFHKTLSQNWSWVFTFIAIYRLLTCYHFCPHEAWWQI